MGSVHYWRGNFKQGWGENTRDYIKAKTWEEFRCNERASRPAVELQAASLAETKTSDFWRSKVIPGQ